MKPYPFLSLFQQHYDFERADRIFADQNLKNCWKQWFMAETLSALSTLPECQDVATDTPYSAGNAAKDDDAFLSVKPGENTAVLADKRSASKCDFSLSLDNSPLHFEVRCGHYESFLKARELKKFTDDLQRIEALKSLNPELNILTVFALYGSFENKDMKHFQPLDNSRRCSYVLDTDLNGSTSIARLSHMRRAGDPRTLVIAYVA